MLTAFHRGHPGRSTLDVRTNLAVEQVAKTTRREFSGQAGTQLEIPIAENASAYIARVSSCPSMMSTSGRAGGVRGRRRSMVRGP
jgi:hypothetical protein